MIRQQILLAVLGMLEGQQFNDFYNTGMFDAFLQEPEDKAPTKEAVLKEIDRLLRLPKDLK